LTQGSRFRRPEGIPPAGQKGRYREKTRRFPLPHTIAETPETILKTPGENKKAAAPLFHPENLYSSAKDTMDKGFCPPARQKTRIHLCMAKIFNAARPEKIRPDGVQRP